MELSKDTYEKLIRKLFTGLATKEELRKIAEIDIVECCMNKQWQASATEETDEDIGNRIWQKIDKRCHTKKKRRIRLERLWKWGAACVAIVLTLGAVWLHSTQGEEEKEYLEAFAREHRLLVLPDSSKVWMQPGSSVYYAKSFRNNRKVRLQGEAMFEVTKSIKHPFRVYINSAFIEVKGTVFRVINKNTHSGQVTLFSGLVDFHHQKSGKRIAMQPHQLINYHADGSLEIKDMSDIEWQDGLYKFKEMPLNALINIINKLYDINIELSANVPVRNYFSGTIRYDELPSEVIEKICYNMNLKYMRQEDKVIIYNPIN